MPTYQQTINSISRGKHHSGCGRCTNRTIRGTAGQPGPQFTQQKTFNAELSIPREEASRHQAGHLPCSLSKEAAVRALQHRSGHFKEVGVLQILFQAQKTSNGSGPGITIPHLMVATVQKGLPPSRGLTCSTAWSPS